MRKIIALSVLCLISCSKTRQIASLGDFEFRRSFAGHEEMTSAEIDSIKESAPEVLSVKDTMLYGFLEKEGIVRGKKLMIGSQVWKYSDASDDKSSDGVSVFYDSNKHCYVLQQAVEDRKFTADIESDNPRLRYAVSKKLNMIFVLDEYYIVNGENYSLKIFELH